MLLPCSSILLCVMASVLDHTRRDPGYLADLATEPDGDFRLEDGKELKL